MKNRQCSIDLIRALAMILVIIVHTKSYFFMRIKKISSMQLGLLGVAVPFGVMSFIEMTKHSVQHYDFVLVVMNSVE